MYGPVTGTHTNYHDQLLTFCFILRCVSPPPLSRGQGEPQSRATFVDSDASS